MIAKKLRKFILPNVLAMVGTSCYLLADTFFISSKAGTDGITALNLVLPIYGIIFAIGAMIGVGSATRFSLSRATGENNYKQYFGNSIFFTLAISLIFVALGIFFPAQVLKLMGADSTILTKGLAYTRVVLLFAPFFMLNFTFTAFVRNDGAPALAMIATISSGMFNILFDYILMYPLNMGMLGAGLATGLSPIVSISICMIHVLSKKSNLRLVKAMPSAKLLFKACNLGIVAFVGEISSGITTMVFNFLLLSLGGNIAVAAYGVIANTALVGTALFNGVSQGLQPLASQSHGCENIKEEKAILRYSAITAIIIAILLVTTVMLTAPFIVNIFNSENSQQLADYATVGIRLYFIGFIFASYNIVKAGFLSATGKAKQSAIIALCRGMVAITLFAFILSAIGGITGVWLAFLTAEVFTTLLSIIMDLFDKKRRALHTDKPKQDIDETIDKKS